MCVVPSDGGDDRGGDSDRPPPPLCHGWDGHLTSTIYCHLPHLAHLTEYSRPQVPLSPFTCNK